ncbi:MAG: ABC transporter permease [Candidatus Cloacimonetes bacterium]|nr:ABC transporter permease [Candidatus Cloacimonadota bacterium]
MFLIKQLALSDFKLRYSNSVLGYLWSLLNPLMLFLVLYFVFSILMRFDVPHYQLYLLLGIVIWNFFAEGTSAAMSALLGKSSLIQKIYFPRIIIIIASNITSIITFFLNLLVFSGFLIFSGVGFNWTYMLFFLYLIQLMLITLGFSMFLSALYVKFKDVQHIWGILTQIWFWLTPIIYPISMVPEKYLWLFSLNPMARIIQDFRSALVYHTIPSLQHHLISLGFCIVIFSVGYFFFKWREPRFAEDL